MGKFTEAGEFFFALSYRIRRERIKEAEKSKKNGRNGRQTAEKRKCDGRHMTKNRELL